MSRERGQSPASFLVSYPRMILSCLAIEYMEFPRTIAQSKEARTLARRKSRKKGKN